MHSLYRQQRAMKRILAFLQMMLESAGSATLGSVRKRQVHEALEALQAEIRGSRESLPMAAASAFRSVTFKI